MKLLKLEFIRSTASIYVFILHFALLYIRELNQFIIKLFLFGPEAVTAFFLLSGFVINYSYLKKRDTFSIYFTKRFRRIYPVYIIGIILSLTCLYITYNQINVSFETIIGHLFMLQNTAYMFKGVLVDCIHNNPPFWSLSHEWWYYMLFIPTLYISSKLKLRGFTVSLIISISSTFIYYLHPNFISLFLIYFVLWYAGAELANIYNQNQKITIKNSWYVIAGLTAVVLVHLVFIYQITLKESKISLMEYPIVMIRYPFAALFFVLSSIYLNRYFSVFIKMIPEKAIAWTASISYGIYLFHYPIILLPNYSPYLVVNIVWKTSLVILIAYVAEVVIQPYINKLIPVKSKS